MTPSAVAADDVGYFKATNIAGTTTSDTIALATRSTRCHLHQRESILLTGESASWHPEAETASPSSGTRTDKSLLTLLHELLLDNLTPLDMGYRLQFINAAQL